MAKRSVDMLPLLDVFMVVLFVFATIQESELDSSIHELDALQAELLEAQASAAAESARAAVLAAELELAGQRERRETELEAELAEYQRACGPRRPGDPLCPAAESEARELAEVAAVHEQLLSNVAVFEIEIGGEKQPDRVVNHCCYRRDPPQGEWRSCGEIPTDETTRADWFDDGAQGLREALRQTRDGYAIILLSHDNTATYQISKDFTRLLHARLRNHYVYDNGVSQDPLTCPLLP
jgi:multidrug efflux pump subunit AcrA (membrane-fusion protein)